jgi:hypothetical protein
MEIVGGRQYVEIRGEKTHDLPPLLVRTSPGLKRLDEVFALAAGIVESEDLVGPPPTEDPAIDREFQVRRLDLAVQLVEEYRRLVTHWKWGDSILEWIRQCETTFETQPDLRSLLRPDLWPHAGRSSFVVLLEDKSVPDESGVDVERAVGLRLTFRQPPPISFFSNQFLFYLQATVAETAFQKWASLSPSPVASLPPERFRFEVVDMAA